MIHSIIVILIIVQLTTPKWVEVHSSVTVKGGILVCNEGCADKNTYEEMYDAYCQFSSYDSYYDNGLGYTQTLCDSVNDVSKAGKPKIALDAISIFFIILWSISMFKCKKFQCIRCLNFFFAFLSLIFFLAGTISWIRSTGADFNDCDSGVCALDGPKLSLAILVIFFVSLKFYLCMACSLYYKRRFKELGRNKEVLGEAKVFIGTAQPQNNIVMPPAVANSQ